MVSRKSINDFLSIKKIAVVGVSRNPRKFGNSVFKEMKNKGYEVFPVNPNIKEFEGEKCYPNLQTLSGKVEGAVLVVPPNETEKTIEEAASAGIKNLWLQQGAESDTAISFCNENNINVVYKECILMFAEPAAFFHKAHRFVNGIFGKLPG
jgi:uncharacterized protein